MHDPPLLIYQLPDPLEFLEIPPDQECLPHDIGIRHESPVTAVAAAVPVVPHHEILACRNGAAEARVIVGTILPEWKSTDSRWMHARRLRLHQDGMTVGPQRFRQPPRRYEIEAGLHVAVFP